MRIMRKKAVVFIAGQSNAHAHGQLLPENERIIDPFPNVFSLDRDPNQAFDRECVVWSGFTTAGKNLGESQDHTASLGYHLAKLWQNAIDQGKDLPDLYIVQISIGSQAIVNGMWNPDRERILIPGPLGTAKIALFHLVRQIYRLVMADLQDAEVLGFHWLGSEQEIWHDTWKSPELDKRYDYFFDKMLASMGQHCPLWLYKINAEHFCLTHDIKPYASENINKALWWQAQRHKDVHMVRPDHCPWWNPEEPLRGIYAPDDAHYLPKVQQWFAEEFYCYVRKHYTF